MNLHAITIPLTIKTILNCLFIITSIVFLYGIYHFHGTQNYSNFLIAYVAFLLALVGYLQLDKLNRGNSLQLLFHLEKDWYSASMIKKRRRFALMFSDWIASTETFMGLDDNNPSWTEKKIIIEDVIDYFEKLAYFVKQHDFDINEVYSLYSYYIQGYWELCYKTKYIQKIRKQPDNINIYAGFEWVYKEVLRKKHLRVFKDADLKRFCDEEEAMTDMYV